MGESISALCGISYRHQNQLTVFTFDRAYVQYISICVTAKVAPLISRMTKCQSLRSKWSLPADCRASTSSQQQWAQHRLCDVTLSRPPSPISPLGSASSVLSHVTGGVMQQGFSRVILRLWSQLRWGGSAANESRLWRQTRGWLSWGGQQASASNPHET